jgi:hypothetical protein
MSIEKDRPYPTVVYIAEKTSLTDAILRIVKSQDFFSDHPNARRPKAASQLPATRNAILVHPDERVTARAELKMETTNTETAAPIIGSIPLPDPAIEAPFMNPSTIPITAEMIQTGTAVNFQSDARRTPDSSMGKIERKEVGCCFAEANPAIPPMIQTRARIPAFQRP